MDTLSSAELKVPTSVAHAATTRPFVESSGHNKRRGVVADALSTDFQDVWIDRSYRSIDGSIACMDGGGISKYLHTDIAQAHVHVQGRDGRCCMATDKDLTLQFNRLFNATPLPIPPCMYPWYRASGKAVVEMKKDGVSPPMARSIVVPPLSGTIWCAAAVPYTVCRRALQFVGPLHVHASVCNIHTRFTVCMYKYTHTHTRICKYRFSVHIPSIYSPFFVTPRCPQNTSVGPMQCLTLLCTGPQKKGTSVRSTEYVYVHHVCRYLSLCTYVCDPFMIEPTTSGGVGVVGICIEKIAPSSHSYRVVTSCQKLTSASRIEQPRQKSCACRICTSALKMNARRGVACV